MTIVGNAGLIGGNTTAVWWCVLAEGPLMVYAGKQVVTRLKRWSNNYVTNLINCISISLQHKNQPKLENVLLCIKVVVFSVKKAQEDDVGNTINKYWTLPFKITSIMESFLQLLLWSSTSMISLSRRDGVLWMAVWMERSNTDKASLTKMKMTLSCGRSDEYDMFLHLGRKAIRGFL